MIHVFLHFHPMLFNTALSDLWLTTEISPDLRINVVLHSCAHSSHRLWQAADGVLYSDLLLHSRGCGTFCEPFSSWIIDRIVSVGLCRISHIVNWAERFGVCYVFLQGFLGFNCWGISLHLLGLSKKAGIMVTFYGEIWIKCNAVNPQLHINMGLFSSNKWDGGRQDKTAIHCKWIQCISLHHIVVSTS